MFGRRILGGPPDGFKLLLGYQVAHIAFYTLLCNCIASACPFACPHTVKVVCCLTMLHSHRSQAQLQAVASHES